MDFMDMVVAGQSKSPQMNAAGCKGGTSMQRNRQSHRTSLREYVNATKLSPTPRKYGSFPE
jgi:hypothetical protein